MSAETSDELRTEVTQGVAEVSRRAREGARPLGSMDRQHKDRILLALARGLRESVASLVEANRQDLEQGRENGLSKPLLDRLQLSEARIEALAEAVEDVMALEDPIGRVLNGRTLPNGARLTQTSVPLGVIGVIYEARPNVTVDIAALALKSGNAAILRGGSAASHTNEMLLSIIRNALRACSAPVDAVQSIDEYGREGATALMNTRGSVDVLIPRGGSDLIQHVVQNARVPVIETGEGNVHVYLDESADPDIARNVAMNAKTSRPSVCNAAETLLIHEGAEGAAVEALRALHRAGVTLHVDPRARQWLPDYGPDLVSPNDYGEVHEVSSEHFSTEFLGLEMAVGVVSSLDEAIDHIARYSTGHTEAIVTDSVRSAEKFIAEVDAAAVVVNASTRFTDGGQFGLGAEVGISTQKIHARGPMGMGELTTTKWILRGEGQIRP